jgi:hypothetical protein
LLNAIINAPLFLPNPLAGMFGQLTPATAKKGQFEQCDKRTGKWLRLKSSLNVGYAPRAGGFLTECLDLAGG